MVHNNELIRTTTKYLFAQYKNMLTLRKRKNEIIYVLRIDQLKLL